MNYTNGNKYLLKEPFNIKRIFGLQQYLPLPLDTSEGPTGSCSVDHGSEDQGHYGFVSFDVSQRIL